MMNTDSFTDEQLLNLINSTITDETEHSINMFTGGSTQVTTTHNNKIINFKVLLYFGYNEKRNPITYTEEINREEYFIWNKAIMLKVESLKIDNVGKSFDKLNARMNKKAKSPKEVIGKEVEGIGKHSTKLVRSRNEDKIFSFSLKQLTAVENLSKEYVTNLQAYITESKRSLSYAEFVNGLEANGKKYKNFKSAYTTWANNKDKWDGTTEVKTSGKTGMVIGGKAL